jgi:hypothetical protein
LATPAACQALVCSGEAQANPIVAPLDTVAGLPSIGGVTPNMPVDVR